MARVHLVIADLLHRLTLKTMLESEGHRVVDAEPDVVIADDAREARRWARTTPTLALATASQVAEAVESMREGVFGYVFVPIQPGEVTLMVARAVQWNAGPEGDPSQPAMRLEEVEARHILAVLRRCKHNRAEAARVLGIGRNTLWRKLKRMDETGLLEDG